MEGSSWLRWKRERRLEVVSVSWLARVVSRVVLWLWVWLLAVVVSELREKKGMVVEN